MIATIIVSAYNVRSVSIDAGEESIRANTRKPATGSLKTEKDNWSHNNGAPHRSVYLLHFGAPDHFDRAIMQTVIGHSQPSTFPSPSPQCFFFWGAD